MFIQLDAIPIHSPFSLFQFLVVAKKFGVGPPFFFHFFFIFLSPKSNNYNLGLTILCIYIYIYALKCDLYSGKYNQLIMSFFGGVGWLVGWFGLKKLSLPM